MSVTDAPVLDDDGPDVLAVEDSFVAPLVERLHAQYGVDARLIRQQVLAVSARFAGARVRSFVPILVEKQVRALYRSSGRLPRPAV